MILVWDTETTGLTLHPEAPLAKQPRMIEFGGVLLDKKGKIVEEHSFLINPQQPIEDIITKITNLTNFALANEPTFSMALPRLRTVFGKASVMIAHNLPFDKAILTHELSRLAAEDFPWPKTGICSVGMYQEQYGYRPKLRELYERVMGRPLEQKHRALDDARALVEILTKESLWKMFM